AAAGAGDVVAEAQGGRVLDSACCWGKVGRAPTAPPPLTPTAAPPPGPAARSDRSDPRWPAPAHRSPGCGRTPCAPAGDKAHHAPATGSAVAASHRAGADPPGAGGRRRGWGPYRHR